MWLSHWLCVRQRRKKRAYKLHNVFRILLHMSEVSETQWELEREPEVKVVTGQPAVLWGIA